MLLAGAFTLVRSRLLFLSFDKNHQRVRELLARTKTDLVTTWPVMTETCHMLDFRVDAQLSFLEWMQPGALQLHELRATDLQRIINLTRDYRDRPMDLADASLLVTSETLDVRQIIRADKKPHENLLYG